MGSAISKVYDYYMVDFPTSDGGPYTSDHQFLRGVNYGNRFIPEDWMANSTESIYGTRFGPKVVQPEDCARVSLCDVEDDRILKWLDYKVQEDDFVKMKEYGVKMLRVPTGYWNWVDLGDVTPNAPERVAARFKNLQSVKPEQYEPYIDKIYEYAQKYDIKVFMEMHGAPGSQNGEIHSGCVTGGSKVGKPQHYFDTEWNKEIAIRTVGKMSEKCKQYSETCYGVGVLNEPQPSLYGPIPSKLHHFLEDYYEKAIFKAREHLDESVPVVLYSWIYDFLRWETNRFPYEKYGKVQWDTHIYTPGSKNVDLLLELYEVDLLFVKEFEKRQNTEVMIGEFALSDLNLDKKEKSEWQRYADEVFPKIEAHCSGAALLWNFDCQYTGWSMKAIAEDIGVEWHL